MVIVDLNAGVGSRMVKSLQEYQIESMFIQAYIIDHAKLANIVKQVVE